jgi:hypothetical protein
VQAVVEPGQGDRVLAAGRFDLDLPSGAHLRAGLLRVLAPRIDVGTARSECRFQRRQHRTRRRLDRQVGGEIAHRVALVERIFADLHDARAWPPDKLIEGSPKNSTSSVPIQPWGADAGAVQKCADFLR